MKHLHMAAARPGRFVDKPPDVPGWVQDVLEAVALNSLAKFILLCHLHDHRDRRFEPPQLPTWSPPRDGLIRQTLDELVARRVLSRRRGRREVSYTYDPEGEKAEVMEQFFAFLDDAWCRTRVLRRILAGYPLARSWSDTTRPA